MCDFDGTFGDELLDGLDSLVEKSLLRQRQDSDGEPRFWMLETIREFGLELLESAGELEAACERHAAWTADEAERLDAESRTGDHPAFLARVDDEYPNVREAIAFARKARDGELLLRLATALWGFWSSRVYGAEGRRALEEALELSGRRPARTLLGLCTLRMLSGSGEQLREAARGGARGVRGAGRRLQPRPGLEPRRPRRGNRDGLARRPPRTPGGRRSRSRAAATTGPSWPRASPG